jgi:2-C-methyl-D-erythritol 4-phosphate cytidylyltransferase/2-C-methyl-D-erythritol 2,4-cyclodiphosphate synthase
LSVVAIIVAAGVGLRFDSATLPINGNSNIPKQYYKIHGKAILAYTIDALAAHSEVDKILVVINSNHEKLYFETIKELKQGNSKLLNHVIGGRERSDSVLKALEYLLKYKPEFVLVHDGCRPYISQDLISRIIDSVKINGAVIPVIESINTVKEVINGKVVKTIERSKIFQAQTPQAFKFDKFLELARKNKIAVTDDATIYESFGEEVHTITGELSNIKITNREDIMSPEYIYRAGTGFDVHSFAKEQEHSFIVLGGVKIPHNQKIIAHSDGDVLIHAIIDAILGACALNDIGYYFPPTNEKYRDANSGFFLQEIVDLCKKEGFEIINIDATIICERPKILAYRDDIRKSLSLLMDLDIGRIGIKATTTEKLGFTGRSEGIAVQAIANVREVINEVA